ncbi:MAG TPA: hypothetical protein VGI31_12480 [Streptosporangiaceae bacterium]|jgi:hypothetical protein
MGRLILTLVGALVAVMVVLWAIHVVIAIFWIAIVAAVAFGVLRVALWGRKSRQ